MIEIYRSVTICLIFYNTVELSIFVGVNAPGFIGIPLPPNLLHHEFTAVLQSNYLTL